jgi:alpha-amylase
MKKILFSIVLISLFTTAHAKKVRFACDMTGLTVNTTGMHVTGDFQTAAGFAGGDWNSASTSLTQEDTTNIYSIVVDIPAFTKYEYKFVNGDLFYEVEFVPEPSRVGYNFNDNRWIYIDSLANDTTNIGAILFGQNAPAGLTLVRFFVDMANETPSANGIHVAGNFQGFDPATTILYSFGINNTNGPFIYEIISYVTQGTYEYKFYNGNSTGTEEIIPGICSVNSNREVTVSSDTLLNLVCFGSCNACLTGINETAAAFTISISPNPSMDFTTLSWNNSDQMASVTLNDISGRVVREYKSVTGNTLQIEKGNLDAGIYFIQVKNDRSDASTTKLIFK